MNATESSKEGSQQPDKLSLAGCKYRTLLRNSTVLWECTSSTTLFNLAYVLPIWIYNKALYVSFFHTYGPELLIAICNVLSYTSSVTIAVQSGDTQAIKHVFERRLACPKNILGEGGTTILHYALIYKHLDMCRVLIECDIDMFVPDSRIPTVNPLVTLPGYL